MKRDDLRGLTLGGNKTRKLEFILDKTLGQGADAEFSLSNVQLNA
jgi:D-cysteine desulfhydrase